ncbi:MAG: hypothetical protein A2144_01050 [Chloroflexi bacterium RBG_16_50_9]|nr:MAG: hypothetical protein A2144_01050 [Chloroflexi bacterium RBG_16_50_9]
MYSEEARYEIHLKGHLDERWAARFEGMSINNNLDPQGFPITVLSGVVADQAALHGVLIKIRDIGIPVISINRIGSK